MKARLEAHECKADSAACVKRIVPQAGEATAGEGRVLSHYIPIFASTLRHIRLDRTDIDDIIILTHISRRYGDRHVTPHGCQAASPTRSEGPEPRPQRVADPLFGEREFFDPRDLVQVKYEMLRRVLTEKRPVTEAATAFGFSRVAFYQTQAAFAEHGLPGLLAKRPGPRGRTNSRQPWWNTSSSNTPRTRACAKHLAEMVLEKFGLTVHPRSIERALAKRRKKRAIDFDRESPSPRPSPEVDWAGALRGPAPADARLWPGRGGMGLGAFDPSRRGRLDERLFRDNGRTPAGTVHGRRCRLF